MMCTHECCGSRLVLVDLIISLFSYCPRVMLSMPRISCEGPGAEPVAVVGLTGATELSNSSYQVQRGWSVATERGLRRLPDDNDPCTTAEHKRRLQAKEPTVQKKMRGGLQHLRDDGEMVHMNITNMAGTAIRISLPICAIRVDSSQDCLFAQPLKISEPNLT